MPHYLTLHNGFVTVGPTKRRNVESIFSGLTKLPAQGERKGRCLLVFFDLKIVLSVAIDFCAVENGELTCAERGSGK